MRFFIILLFFSNFLIQCREADALRYKESREEDFQEPSLPNLPFNETLRNLQGNWVESGDSSRVISIAGDKYAAFSSNTLETEYRIEAYENCPGYCAEDPGVARMPCFVLKGTYDASCYVILQLDATRMRCYMLGSGGQIQEFTRKKI